MGGYTQILSVIDATQSPVAEILAAVVAITFAIDSLVPTLWKRITLGGLGRLRGWGLTNKMHYDLNWCIVALIFLAISKPAVDAIAVYGLTWVKIVYVPIYLLVSIAMWKKIIRTRWMIYVNWSEAEEPVRDHWERWSMINSRLKKRRVYVWRIFAAPLGLALLYYGPWLLRQSMI